MTAGPTKGELITVIALSVVEGGARLSSQEGGGPQDPGYADQLAFEALNAEKRAKLAGEQR